MQVDDRISLKTWHWRQSVGYYDSQVVRFGASDAVSLKAVHYSIEGVPDATGFWGMALSRNPGHLLAPPDEIAEWVTDEALYARGQWWDTTRGGTLHAFQAHIGTQVIPLYDIIVPSRQITVAMAIGGSGAYGMVAELYFREVKLSSREEADLLNITWGKYRR